MADPPVAPSPATRRGDDHDAYHGVAVADPYRWLEDGDSPEVVEWVAAHNKRTREALDARPDRERWIERLSALTALPTVLGAVVRGEQLFVSERPAGSDQFVLMLRSAVDPTVAPRALLDPASLAEDAAMAIDWFHPSPDGSLVAFGLSEGGTEDSTMHMLEVATGERLADTISDTRAASVAWLPDGSGFWYTRYPAGDEYHRHVRFHRLGTDPVGDPVVFDSLPTPQSWPDVQSSPDGRYLLVEMLVGWGRIDVHLLDTTTGTWHEVIAGQQARTGFVFHRDRLVGTTTFQAPNGRLVAVPLDGLAGGQEIGPQSWQTVVPERDVVLGGVVGCGRQLLLIASRDGVDTVERWSLDGAPGGTIDALGVVAVASLDADEQTATAFITAVSFERPATVFRFGPDGLRSWCPEPSDTSVLAQLTVSQVKYPSLDGTAIGMFLIHRADVTPSSHTPLILTGYGGFAITESPAWSPNIAAWCAAGGVYAIAGLRGGSEHGEAWHWAGRRDVKQNVFDDFHAGADWLVSNGFTSRRSLAIVGGSNGGLLMGVAITQ
ncbi:MAG: prolyl oligopeptidase family serine peptidase, partial [Ilumatobacteraceae bacterium]